ncbi:Tetratricopeptide repeat protein 33 [Linum perenne]
MTPGELHYSISIEEIPSLILIPAGREAAEKTNREGGKAERQSEREMKVTWNKEKVNKKRPFAAISRHPNLPFDKDEDLVPNHTTINNKESDNSQEGGAQNLSEPLEPSDSESNRKLSQSFQAQGDKLAEEGRYREALGKWEAAINLTPENAVLHEQKAQVLLEVGDAWSALKAATRATQLRPSWPEAWVTLGRAQLNFGEPDDAIESFDRALAIQPDFKEAEVDRRTASQLVRKRKQLHSTGLSVDTNRYVVQDKMGSSATGESS